MSASAAISSSVSKSFRSIPAAVKAASVGAKTVNGPSAWSAVTKSALASAATRLSWSPVSWALAGISLVSSADTLSGVTEINRQATIRNALIRFMGLGVILEYITRGFLPKRRGICIRAHPRQFAAIGCILRRDLTWPVHRF